MIYRLVEQYYVSLCWRKRINIHQYTFIVVHGKKFMALPSDKNDENFTGSRIFRPTKICFIRYHQHFCGKLKVKLFSELLKIFRKT